MIRLSLLLITLGSCAIKPEVEYIDPTPQEKWEQCEPWLYHDGEVWMNCMMMA